MSKLLLLIHTEADVAHLPQAAQAILASSISGIWCVFSPAITVNASEAAAKLDTEIATLKAAESSAANREDYEAAKGYKVQREGKILDRAAALRDAWKTASAEDRKAKTGAIFQPFLEPLQKAGLNVRITGHSDHYDREQWVAMLNSLSGVWFKMFTPGSFIVAWPEAMWQSIKATSDKFFPSGAGETVIKPIGVAPLPSPTEKNPPAVKPKTRQEELEAMHPMKRRKLAKDLGIDLAGKNTPKLIEAILGAEIGALAEY